ncbi:BTAD domain-containing putative transcriptional regulator [uncultured Streptomyces sp.]|uniref:AfsR/SARP family transcriptional regulator n=1 Tax=uncultured Streptomyces sp. TaxID=174707 RepID=UPI0026052CD6|nr:BTAD domain-containing putative transcriptional regulator [uncultured Streptomyces sp.]
MQPLPADDFRVLGPLSVRLAGHPVTITSPKQRVLLASLLLRADQVVTSDELIRRLWDDAPPRDTRAALHVHTTRLRALMRGAEQDGPLPLIETHPGGYRLALAPGALDLTRSRAAAAEALRARHAIDPHRELAALETALAEWRGEPFGTVDSTSLRNEVVPQLVEEHLALAERRYTLALSLGQAGDLIPQLRALCAEHPLRERLRQHLMTALQYTGQIAAALEEYRDYYQMLDQELGLLPGQELRQLHRGLLNEAAELSGLQGAPGPAATDGAARRVPAAAGRAGGRAVAAPRAGTTGEQPGSGPAVLAGRPADPGAPWVVQRQLPPEATCFVGREDLLAELTGLLAPTGRASVPLVSLVGPPGIGKTALALRVAHRLSSAYPDGQWYVRLSDSRGTERPSHEVVADLLHASGMDVSGLPRERQQLTGMLRSRLADRRVLIVLDDVQNSGRIADLLPGTPSSAVLTLHRAYSTELVAVHGARVLTLNLISHEEAADLITMVLDRDEAQMPRAAVAELVQLCDRLPLALRIVGGHLAGRPWLSVQSFVEELREGGRQGVLDLGDSPTTALRAAFGLAYRSLPALSQRFFRLLGGVCDMSFTPHTAAQLADCSPVLAAGLLDKLAAAQLLEVESARTYRFHSLIGLYAAERGRGEDTAAERREALERLCQWYLRRTEEAVRSCYPGFIRLYPPQAPLPGDTVAPRAAQCWLRSEHANLMALVERAAKAPMHEACVRLADMLRGYFMLGRLQADWLTVARAGLRAAEQLGDRRAEAVMRLCVGLALQGGNDLAAAGAHLRAAHREFVRLDVKDFEAVTVNALAMNQLQQPTKHIDGAITLLDRGLRLSSGLGLRHVEARSHMYLGMARHSQGMLPVAEAHFRASLAILREEGVHRSQPEVLARLGLVHTDLHRWSDAVEQLSLAMAFSEEFHTPHSTVLASYGLAQVHACRGQTELAYRYAESAVALAVDHGYSAPEANARNVLGGLHLLLGRTEEAGAEYRRTLDIALRIGHPQSQVTSLLGLARLELDAGRPARTRALAERAAGVARASGLHRLQTQATGVILLAKECAVAGPGPGRAGEDDCPDLVAPGLPLSPDCGGPMQCERRVASPR